MLSSWEVIKLLGIDRKQFPAELPFFSPIVPSSVPDSVVKEILTPAASPLRRAEHSLPSSL